MKVMKMLPVKYFTLILVSYALAGCVTHETADKLNARSNQLAQKATDAVFNELDRIVSGIFLEEPTKITLPQGMKLRKMSDAGLAITKESEGFVSNPYNDPAGYCTVGYGHLIAKSFCSENKITEIRECETSNQGELQTGINPVRGEQILRCDMLTAEIALTRLLRPDLNDDQFSALVDLAFNIGIGNFKKSILLKAVNEGDFQRIPIEFRRYVYADGKLYPGLKKRREKEIALFFGGPMKGIEQQPSEFVDIRTGETIEPH